MTIGENKYRNNGWPAAKKESNLKYENEN